MSTWLWYQTTTWGSCSFLTGGSEFLGFGGGEGLGGGLGAVTLTASAKLLMEEVVSSLKSLNLLTRAATTGVMSSTGAGGVGGLVGVVFRGISSISIRIAWS